MHAMVITLAANYTTRYVSVRAIWHKPCLRNEMSVRCVYTYICLPLYHIGTDNVTRCIILAPNSVTRCIILAPNTAEVRLPIYHFPFIIVDSGGIPTIVLILTLGLMTASTPLQWRHNESDGVSNQHRHEWLLNYLFRRRSKKISKLRSTGLYEGEFTGHRWIPHTKGQ